MASDLAERLRAAKEPGHRGGVPECLIAAERKTVRLGLGSVDDTDAISRNLANEVHPKANRMITWYKEPGSILNYPGHGQIGFLRGDPLPPSPGGRTRHFHVHPVTAKHNLRHYIDEEKTEYTAKHSLVVLGDFTAAKIDFGGDLDWVPDEKLDAFSIREESVMTTRPAIWKFGIDISEAAVIAAVTKGVTDELNAFLPVRSSFRLEKGQKVGISIIFTEKTRPTPRTVAGCGEDEKNISNEELEKIYGQPNEVNIYTGEITHVGEKHIEYDINSFTTCSGAIVFLLDKDQPESVDPRLDHGKAVAIHAGAHPFVNDRNLGFKLRGNVESVGRESVD